MSRTSLTSFTISITTWTSSYIFIKITIFAWAALRLVSIYVTTCVTRTIITASCTFVITGFTLVTRIFESITYTFTGRSIFSQIVINTGITIRRSSRTWSTLWFASRTGSYPNIKVWVLTITISTTSVSICTIISTIISWSSTGITPVMASTTS